MGVGVWHVGMPYGFPGGTAWVPTQVADMNSKTLNPLIWTRRRPARFADHQTPLLLWPAQAVRSFFSLASFQAGRALS